MNRRNIAMHIGTRDLFLIFLRGGGGGEGRGGKELRSSLDEVAELELYKSILLRPNLLQLTEEE